MGLTFPDYTKLVKEDYESKRSSNKLSLLLARPTPANLRDACVHVYKARYERKDERILTAFFGPEEPHRKFPQIIEGFDIDKFRPIIQYLKGSTKLPDPIIIDLLAWLLDFHPRPWSLDTEIPFDGIKHPDQQAYASPTPELTPPVKRHGLKENSGPEPISTMGDSRKQGDERAGKRKRIITAFSFLLAASVSGGSYIFWKGKIAERPASKAAITGCMYWADTAYAEILCTEKRNGMLTLPLDAEKIKTFKRITQPDTITERSVGRIYYLKNNKSLEFFTAGGNHPIQVTRSLHKLSAYIFEKYLRKSGKKDAGGEDALAGFQTEN